MASVGDKITGKNGKIMYDSMDDGTADMEYAVTKFSINKSTTPVKSTDNGDKDANGQIWDTYEEGKTIGWNGSIEAKRKAGVAKPPFNKKFLFEGYSDDGIYVSGIIILNSEGYTVATVDGEDVVTQFGFQGSGELTETDPTV